MTMNILWIRLRSLGDTLLSIPVLGALKKYRPQSRISFVVQQPYANLFFNHPFIDRVLVIPSGARYRWHVYLHRPEWLKESYDVIINAHGGLASTRLTRLGRAPVKIGFTRYRFPRTYSHLMPLSESDYHEFHTIEILSRLLQPILGFIPKREFIPPIEIPLLKNDSDNFQELEQFRDGRPLIFFHPGGRFRSKRWPIERSLPLIRAWAQKFSNYAFALFVGPDEAWIPLEFLHESPVFPVRNLNLPQVLNIFRKTHLFIGFDTGIMHLAAAAGTPMMILWGASYPILWAPWHVPFIRVSARDSRCLQCTDKTCPVARPHPCIDDIDETRLTRILSLYLQRPIPSSYPIS